MPPQRDWGTKTQTGGRGNMNNQKEKGDHRERCRGQEERRNQGEDQSSYLAIFGMQSL